MYTAGVWGGGGDIRAPSCTPLLCARGPFTTQFTAPFTTELLAGDGP